MTFILPETVVSWIQRERFGVLATTGPEFPHATLVSLAFEAEPSPRLVFPTKRDTVKFANLVRDPRVSVLLDERTRSDIPVETIRAMTLFGHGVEAAGHDREFWRARLLVKHPDLAEFTAVDSTALIVVSLCRAQVARRIGAVEDYRDG